jgi:mannose-6-phosphate isomerase-like protein (cupin superfamily)
MLPPRRWPVPLALALFVGAPQVFAAERYWSSKRGERLPPVGEQLLIGPADFPDAQVNLSLVRVAPGPTPVPVDRPSEQDVWVVLESSAQAWPAAASAEHPSGEGLGGWRGLVGPVGHLRSTEVRRSQRGTVLLRLSPRKPLLAGEFPALRAFSPQEVSAHPIAKGKGEVRMVVQPPPGAFAYAGLLRAFEGMRASEHQHAQEAELLYILEGEGRMTILDKSFRVLPGMAIYVPPATLHRFEQVGRKPLSAMQFYSPAGPEQRFRPAESR